MKKTIFLLFVLVVWINNSFSQETKRVKVSGFPAAYYTPETSLALGAFGLMNFNWKSDSLEAKRSSVTLGAAYTLRNQILFYLPFNLFLKNDDYRLNGELGYYKYVYNFFGIGNIDGSYDEKNETFQISFPRIRATVLKKLRPKYFIGFKYGFDAYYDLILSDSSKISNNNITGIKTGINSGLGPAFLYDSRNSVFYPRSGGYVDASLTIDLGEIVSDYSFQRLIIDAAGFKSLTKRTVLGANLNIQQNTGDVPFYHLSLLGGAKRLRGQFEGEFRDKIALQSQIEIRQEILDNLGIVVFTGVGWVSPSWSALQSKNYHLGSGVGLRYKLNKNDHVNLRLDVGFGEGKIWPYFTIGEAF